MPQHKRSEDPLGVKRPNNVKSFNIPFAADDFSDLYMMASLVLGTMSLMIKVLKFQLIFQVIKKKRAKLHSRVVPNSKLGELVGCNLLTWNNVRVYFIPLVRLIAF
jgi:hypothetical protein